MSAAPNDAASPDDTDDRLELAPEARFPEEEEKKSLWGKLKRGLFMTHTEVIDRIEAAMEDRAVIDDETAEFLEESLIGADIGVETAMELVETVRARIKPGQAKDLLAMRDILADEISVLLLDAPQPPPRGTKPLVTLIVGVNGAGKTTSIAKLAKLATRRDGEKVLLAAGDTFRAAAIEQLSLWGERVGVDVVRQQTGGDPAAVVYDALQAARARKVDQIIVDTAGRLHNKEHLMKELNKIGRVIEREAPDWAQRTVLVLDATSGQNAIVQAREFTKTVDVDGVILTKLDGTAKGGMAVAVARDLRLPMMYLGVGEGMDDLIAFNARDFASALFR
ncbi:MAG: signal recognition particle-docking protein FtsY [Acidobacteriota bacterium]